MYQVKDRVVAVKNDGRVKRGMMGTVVEIYRRYQQEEYLYVSWDAFIGGHDNGGFGKDGYGWNVYASTVMHIDNEPDDEPKCISDSEITKFLFD